LDKIDLKFEMPLRFDENVYSVDLFLFFDVKLHVSGNLSLNKDAQVYDISDLALISRVAR
jgi:hypothetical protein